MNEQKNLQINSSMKGSELLPDGDILTCLHGNRVDCFYDTVPDYADSEDLEPKETFTVEVWKYDGGSLCESDGEFYEIENNGCDCNGDCKNKVPSASVIGIATIKVLDADYEVEVIKYEPNKR